MTTLENRMCKSVRLTIFLAAEFRGKRAKLSKSGKKLHKRMGAADQPRYNGFCVIRDRVITALQYIQSTLIISNSKGLSELLRDNRTSTYQICRSEEKIFRITTFNKYICNWTLEVRDMLKIL